MSDVPIRFSPALRARMLASRKAKGIGGMLSLLKGLSLKDLAPETPPIAEFSTGETMGHSADRLALAFGVTREESDSYALRSHQRARFFSCLVCVVFVLIFVAKRCSGGWTAGRYNRCEECEG